ncbi:hypothetical protein B0T26DRAFT_728496 [Lasiosphaeria miniovina]|uniref:Uncharacterized protein n=1 Tax=Lasiosphaeria miniovina TaxID=1954250 RepID=A0AA40DN27_9PEZI|nr:uncharacterized protein B0T26DRAFT_728496 [Lasiosphaeria miniovina]KAK0706897.1 hypothetical protein B0T26DRAFT_728496 [Lasiosphaeria miniovina]
MPDQRSIQRALRARELLNDVKSRMATPSNHGATEIINLIARSRYGMEGIMHLQKSSLTVAGMVRAAKFLRRTELERLFIFDEIRDAALKWLNGAPELDPYWLDCQRHLSNPGWAKEFIFEVTLYLWQDDCDDLLRKVFAAYKGNLRPTASRQINRLWEAGMMNEAREISVSAIPSSPTPVIPPPDSGPESQPITSNEGLASEGMDLYNS